MAEYLSPGVYVEETSFRAKSMAGVSTSTAGFVGLTRTGPVNGLPQLVTSFAEFNRIFGGLEPVTFADGSSQPNFIAQAVRAFFQEGGSRVYIARIFKKTDGATGDGIAKGTFGPLNIRARHAGSGGLATLRATVHLGENTVIKKNGEPTLQGLKDYDVVWVTNKEGATSVKQVSSKIDASGNLFLLLDDSPLGEDEVSVRPILLDLTVIPKGETSGATFANMTWDPQDSRSVFQVFSKNVINPSNPLVVEPTAEAASDGKGIAEAMLDAQIASTARAYFQGLPANPSLKPEITAAIPLTGGNDGALPGTAEYEGSEDPVTHLKTGLTALADVEDIAIVAAPGATYNAGPDPDAPSYARAQAVTGLVIGHCERLRYRVAIIDTPNGFGLPEALRWRQNFDSKYAALYYPWIKIMDPVSSKPVLMPPSGFVAGICARNDNQNGVHKAPANEVVNLAIGFEFDLGKGQQDVLNPSGINCFRSFSFGKRLWGARTISSDPEWKYFNVRRYFVYLEHSVDAGTQWAVFMNNDQFLWDSVRRTIESFLFNEWTNRRLFGATPAEAYFVRCDLTTMTQNDLDNGRLVCEIGVSPLKPAEFVIFRIGQWTANAG